MLIKALERAEGENLAQLTKWINATDFCRTEKISAVTDIYTKLDIQKIAQDKINQYFHSAMEHLNAIDVTPDRKEELLQFVRLMMKREK